MVFRRGNTDVCVACMCVFGDGIHGFNEPSADPRVIEEVGNAFFPPPNGFRVNGWSQIMENV